MLILATSLYIYCNIFPFLAHYGNCSSTALLLQKYMYVKRTLQCKYDLSMNRIVNVFSVQAVRWMFKLFDMFSLPICFEVTKRWIVLVVWWFEDTFEFVFWLTVFPFNIFKCWCRGNTILFDVDRAKNIPDYLDGTLVIVEFSILLKLVFPIKLYPVPIIWYLSGPIQYLN